jgi:hypothetical protein
LRSPGVSAADGQGKKGLEEQNDDMFGLTPYFSGVITDALITASAS